MWQYTTNGRPVTTGVGSRYGGGRVAGLEFPISAAFRKTITSLANNGWFTNGRRSTAKVARRFPGVPVGSGHDTSDDYGVKRLGGQHVLGPR